jgi:hypothetical protein
MQVFEGTRLARWVAGPFEELVYIDYFTSQDCNVSVPEEAFTMEILLPTGIRVIKKLADSYVPPMQFMG